MSLRRVAVWGGLLLLGTVVVIADPAQYLSLAVLQDRHQELLRWTAEKPGLAALVFFTGYVLVTAVSIPGAAVLTVAAGAIFGVVWGSVLVSFASTLGATLAFLLARGLFHEAVQRRFGDRLAAVNRGMARDGAFYLFTLRLVPVFPFFVINLVMALTPIRTRTYYWVSQLGMLPATVVYVNAGTQLAQLQSLADILSPSLLASFALLGVFPLLARTVLAVLQRRRVYAKWRKPQRFDRNLIVIGAGAAGLVSAYIGAAVRARVTLVEAREMGGDCLNTGCVPSKALIQAGKLAAQQRDSARFGLISAEPQIDFPRLMRRVQSVIREIAPHDSVERYESLGVEVIQGYARLRDPWTVEIQRHQGDVCTLTTRSVILATGAAPTVPDLDGLAAGRYLTSETLWEALAELPAVPERLVVLGGGPIGCELSQAMARLGCAVTLVERGERLLKREDPEVSAAVREALSVDGVSICCSSLPRRVEWHGEGGLAGRLLLDQGGGERWLEYDLLLCAVGRTPRLSGFGLEDLAIPVERTVLTNDYLETYYPNIYAAGDVAGPYQLTHVGAHQAWYAVVNALFGRFRRFKADYRVIPQVVFTDPEAARVGLSEQEAREQNLRYEVTRFELDDLDRAIVDGAKQGFVKVLTAVGTDRILGVTIVGCHSGELIAEFVLAMKHRLGLNKVLGTIHSYPTWAEANKYVAGSWKRAHAPQVLLRLVERYHRWRCGGP